MSEHPTERFERPLLAEHQPDPAPTFEPLFPPEPEPPLSDYPAGAATTPPPAPPITTPPPVPPTTAMPPVTPPPVTSPPPADEQPTTRLRTAERPSARSSSEPSAAVAAARQWFADADNVLMAVTAAIAVLFIVLVAALH